MSVGDPTFEDLLLGAVGNDIDLIRFCMSDKAALNLNAVLTDSMSPIQYAEILIAKQYPLLRDLFFKQHVRNKKLHEEFLKGWVFDRLVTSGALLRIATLRTVSMDPVHRLMSTAMPFLLRLEEGHSPESHYCGLADFAIICEFFISHNEGILFSADIPLLRRMSHGISTINRPNWIFYRPLWQKLFLSNPQRLTILRHFLHVALLTYAFTDDQIYHVFEISRRDIHKLIYQFVELVEDDDITEGDIKDFLGSVSYHTENALTNAIYEGLFESSFEVFEEIHRRNYFDRYKKVDVPAAKQDYPTWTFLRNLGEEFSPEQLIESDIIPTEYLSRIIKEHKETIENIIAINPNERNEGDIILDDVVLSNMSDAIIGDSVLREVIFRRYYHLYDSDFNKAMLRTNMTEHVIFLMSVEKENLTDNDFLGFSRAALIIDYHHNRLKDNLTEEESDSVLALKKVLDPLRAEIETPIGAGLLKALNHRETRDSLRVFLFTLIEVLWIPKTDLYSKYLGMNRTEFFSYIRKLSEVLSTSTDFEDIFETVVRSPTTAFGTTVKQWDQHVWANSFGNIPPRESSQQPCIDSEEMPSSSVQYREYEE